jgi:sortase A
MEITPLGNWLGYHIPPAKSLAQTQHLPATAPSAAPPSLPEGALIGRVEIPRLHLSAMVRQGVDQRTLATAVGHVPSTQAPGDIGNFAIAAHRDTLFRALKDIKIGDTVNFQSPDHTYAYRVISTQIVKPSDVSVLRPQGNQRLLTMITCYPFYYVGSAPKRFIVTAKLDETAGRS